MRLAPEPPISEHRLSRLTLWAGLWLARLAALLLGEGRVPAVIEQGVARFSRIVRGVIMLRVAAAMPPLRQMRRPWPLRTLTAQRRAVFGSAVRRILRARTLAERIAKLRAFAANIDAICERLLRRLQRGLTRRRPRQWRPECALALAFPQVAPLVADTS